MENDSYGRKHTERNNDNMTFGVGYKITRWNWEADEFVVYQKGYPEGMSCNKQTAEAYGINEGDLFKCNPYL